MTCNDPKFAYWLEDDEVYLCDTCGYSHGTDEGPDPGDPMIPPWIANPPPYAETEHIDPGMLEPGRDGNDVCYSQVDCPRCSHPEYPFESVWDKLGISARSQSRKPKP